MPSGPPTMRLIRSNSPEKGGGVTKNYKITLLIDLINTVYVPMLLKLCVR